MHEFAVTKIILQHVQNYAEKNDAGNVTDVYLRIGALRGMINDWVERYFAYASKGTNVEGAKVHIQTVEGSLICSCGTIMPLAANSMPTECCACGGKDLRIRSGTEFDLLSIAITRKQEESED